MYNKNLPFGTNFNNINANSNVLITAQQSQKLNEYIQLEQLVTEYTSTEEGKQAYQSYYEKWLEALSFYKTKKENPALKKTSEDLDVFKTEIKSEMEEIKSMLKKIIE